MRTEHARSAALYARIRASIDATPAGRMRTPVRTVAALAIVFVLSIGILLLASELVYGRQGVGLQFNVLSTTRLIWMTYLLLVLTLISTTIALWRGSAGLGAGSVPLAWAAALLAPLYALLVLWKPVHLQDAYVPLVEISPWGVRCFGIATLVGVTVLIGFATALRRAVPVATHLRGAVLGAAAGAWAGFAVFVFCPSGEPLHLMLGHVLPVVGLTALGSVALAGMLRP